MVTRRYVIGIIGILSIAGLGVANEFTAKREKHISTTTLKEDCCEQFGMLLKQIPSLLHAIAQLQVTALTAIEGYWQGDKQSWCAQASRQQLQLCRDRLTSLQKKIDMVLAECDQALKEIK